MNMSIFNGLKGLTESRKVTFLFLALIVPTIMMVLGRINEDVYMAGLTALLAIWMPSHAYEQGSIAKADAAKKAAIAANMLPVKFSAVDPQS